MKNYRKHFLEKFLKKLLFIWLGKMVPIPRKFSKTKNRLVIKYVVIFGFQAKSFKIKKVKVALKI